MQIDVAFGGDFLGRIGYDCARIGPDHNLGPTVTPADAGCGLSADRWNLSRPLQGSCSLIVALPVSHQPDDWVARFRGSAS